MAKGIEVEGTWYTTAEAAEELGLSHDTVRSAVRMGTLKARRLSARVNLVSAEAIEEYRRNHLGKRGRPPRHAAEDSDGDSPAGSTS